MNTVMHRTLMSGFHTTSPHCVCSVLPPIFPISRSPRKSAPLCRRLLSLRLSFSSLFIWERDCTLASWLMSTVAQWYPCERMGLYNGIIVTGSGCIRTMLSLRWTAVVLWYHSWRAGLLSVVLVEGRSSSLTSLIEDEFSWGWAQVILCSLAQTGRMFSYSLATQRRRPNQKFHRWDTHVPNNDPYSQYIR